MKKKVIQKYLLRRVSLWCPGKQERQRKVRVGGWGGGAPPQHLSVGIPLESPLSI